MSHQEVGTEKLYTDKINSLWLQIKEWEGQKTEVYLEINGRVFAERPGHHNLTWVFNEHNKELEKLRCVCEELMWALRIYIRYHAGDGSITREDLIKNSEALAKAKLELESQ